MFLYALNRMKLRVSLITISIVTIKTTHYPNIGITNFKFDHMTMDENQKMEFPFVVLKLDVPFLDINCSHMII